MVYILLGRGFEETEAVAPYDVLHRGGVDVRFAGVGGRTVSGGHGIEITCACTVEEIDLENTEMIVVPGGMGGVESIEKSSAAMELVKKAYDAGKRIAAICAGPRVLAGLGILDGVQAVCYPGMENEMAGGLMTQDQPAVTCGRVTTGRAAGTALDFGLELLTVLKGRETAQKVAGSIYYER